MSRQFKNRKAVDPDGKDYSTIPDTIQWGDMMITKDASPDIWEKYAAKIKAREKSPKGYPTQSTQQQPLRSVPAGTIREPLFGRNPDGSPKPRPAGMDAEQVLALAQAQERQYNPPQKTTKKTSKATSAKPASTPPGVIGYDALNQPVYGRRPTAQEPVRSDGLPEAIVRELTVRAARGDSNAARNLSNIQKAERSGSMPDYKTAMPSGSVWSGSYDNAGNPIYGVPVPGMKVNLPKGSPLPKDQVLAMRQEAIEAEKQRQADWSTGGRPTKEALLAKQGITGNNQALAVWDGSYDSNGDPRYGIPVPGMKANVPKGQPLNREQAKAQKAEVSKWASIQNKQRTDTPASTIAPYRDMQGYPVKLDDMYISGGLGKSAESKKESAAAKKKASQPASTKGAGQAGGSFRVINGQVRFFGSGADVASEVEAVKPTGMR